MRAIADAEFSLLVTYQVVTGHGQTNKLLKEIATYACVFERLHGFELQRYIEKVAINAPGFYEHCQHQYEISRRCTAWATAVEKYYWPFGDEPLRDRKPFKDICQQRANDARARIADAVKWLPLRKSSTSTTVCLKRSIALPLTQNCQK